MALVREGQCAAQEDVARHQRDKSDPSGPQHAGQLRGGPVPLGRRGQVVEGAQRERRVEGAIRPTPEVAGVGLDDLFDQRARGGRGHLVLRDGQQLGREVGQHHAVATLRQPEAVAPGAAPTVEHARARRQVGGDGVRVDGELDAALCRGQPRPFALAETLVVGAHVVARHGASPQVVGKAA